MGQYHNPVSVEKAEGFVPHDVGAGLKAGEQLYTPYSVAAALVGLVCLRGGNMPADMSQSPLIGRWAATRVLMQGDYAEDGDIPNWEGPRLSELYEAVGFKAEQPKLEDYQERYKNSALDETTSVSLGVSTLTTMAGLARPGTKAHAAFIKKRWQSALKEYEAWIAEHANHPVFADISADVQGLLEGACSVRFFGMGWRAMVRVKQKATAVDGVAEFELVEGYSKEDMDYFLRCGLSPIDYMRGPRSGDWSGLSDADVDKGETRVLLNLDTMEYLDPVKFGEVPTIGGMMLGEFGGSACAMQAFLFHPARRGGGDLPSSKEDFAKMSQPETGGVRQPSNRGRFGKPVENVVGRWRGGHIIGTREFSNDAYPSTEEAKARGVDVSELAQSYLNAIKDW